MTAHGDAVLIVHFWEWEPTERVIQHGLSHAGNAGQITVSAPALAPVPTLTMADGGTISVATSGAGSAGSILLNANTLSLIDGAQVVSSTSNIGNAGSISLNVSEFTQTGGGSRVESSTSGAGAWRDAGVDGERTRCPSQAQGAGCSARRKALEMPGRSRSPRRALTPVPTWRWRMRREDFG